MVAQFFDTLWITRWYPFNSLACDSITTVEICVCTTLSKKTCGICKSLCECMSGNRGDRVIHLTHFECHCNAKSLRLLLFETFHLIVHNETCHCQCMHFFSKSVHVSGQQLKLRLDIIVDAGLWKFTYKFTNSEIKELGLETRSWPWDRDQAKDKILYGLATILQGFKLLFETLSCYPFILIDKWFTGLCMFRFWKGKGTQAFSPW